MLTVFERIELDRGWGRAGLQREVHQVGGGTSLLPATTTTRSVARSEKLVVVKLVTTGPSVSLVLRHGVRNRLVHINVDLGAQHGHVVACQQVIDQCQHAAKMM